MNREDAMRALAGLSATSVDHVGSRIDPDANGFVRVCARCGAEARLPAPFSLRAAPDPSLVPPGFDEELYAWLVDFRDRHAGCPPRDGAPGPRRGERERVVDRVGTISLVDTGRRCSVRDVRILALECSVCGRDPDLLHDAIADPVWSALRAAGGRHNGCDPASPWRRDPAAARLARDTHRRLLDRSDACPACGESTCTGSFD